ncbi:MAG: hypothetical protein ACRDGS_00725 [Chloroflexota bacterium]
MSRVKVYTPVTAAHPAGARLPEGRVSARTANVNARVALAIALALRPLRAPCPDGRAARLYGKTFRPQAVPGASRSAR